MPASRRRAHHADALLVLVQVIALTDTNTTVPTYALKPM